MLLVARMTDIVNEKNKDANGHWQETYFELLKERNLIPKNFKGNKNWQKTLTRGEFFSFVYRAIQRKHSQTKNYIGQFEINLPNQEIYRVPTRRTLLSHPDLWVEKLKKGAAFYEDKSRDRLVVFAHSSNFPGEQNPIVKFYGNIFRPLINNVNAQDPISITLDDYTIKYRVTSVERVDGNQIESLRRKDDSDLIVFTCDADPRYRWIIRAIKSRH